MQDLSRAAPPNAYSLFAAAMAAAAGGKPNSAGNPDHSALAAAGFFGPAAAGAMPLGAMGRPPPFGMPPLGLMGGMHGGAGGHPGHHDPSGGLLAAAAAAAGHQSSGLGPMGSVPGDSDPEMDGDGDDDACSSTDGDDDRKGKQAFISYCKQC